MQRLVTKMNFQDNRILVFHSIRKSGAMFQFRLHNNIIQAKEVLGHANVNTTQLYLSTQDYGAIGAVSSGGNLDKEVYKKTDYDTLIQALDEMNDDQKLILSLKIQELNKNKVN
ncbi:hypothetical protein D3C84_608640 [compost metagenome]